MLGEEAIDSGLEIDDGMEHTAFQPPFRELGEEALDGVEPGSRGRREVKVEPGMALQPFLDLGVLVGRVVVDDEMDVPVLWGLAIDLVEEADELLMPVALYALADDSEL